LNESLFGIGKTRIGLKCFFVRTVVHAWAKVLDNFVDFGLLITVAKYRDVF